MPYLVYSLAGQCSSSAQKFVPLYNPVLVVRRPVPSFQVNSVSSRGQLEDLPATMDLVIEDGVPSATSLFPPPQLSLEFPSPIHPHVSFRYSARIDHPEAPFVFALPFPVNPVPVPVLSRGVISDICLSLPGFAGMAMTFANASELASWSRTRRSCSLTRSWCLRTSCSILSIL
jgi:hypothetical protein